MASKVFINLPVKNLQQSIAFFTKLGFSFNLQFTDDKATCMVVSESIYVMLLVEERFKDFTKKEIADATNTTEVIICLDADSKDAVNEIVNKAVAAGGSVYRDPEDHGWMYGHAFADLDGHQWEFAWMDPGGMPQQ